MIKLKSLCLQSDVIQSPMAGCTDLAYRLVARKHGMELAFLEMVSAESLIRGVEKTHELMQTDPLDKPLGAQLVGCRPDAMGQAARIVEEMGFDLVDINFGCPVPKVAGKGAGSALLAQPETARAIFTQIVQSVKKIPVTVKMRLGVEDPSGREAVAIARIAEDCGIDAVTVHGRTRTQGYGGNADYEAIGRVKQAVRIPVIGNGDILSGTDALRMKKTSGVDGVMIGRGGLGNPWLFRSIQNAFTGKAEEPDPSFEEKKITLLRHMELEVRLRGEKMAHLHLKRIACWYFKNVPGVHTFKAAVNLSPSLDDTRRLIENFDPAPPPSPCINPG